MRIQEPSNKMRLIVCALLLSSIHSFQTGRSHRPNRNRFRKRIYSKTFQFPKKNSAISTLTEITGSSAVKIMVQSFDSRVPTSSRKSSTISSSIGFSSSHACIQNVTKAPSKLISSICSLASSSFQGAEIALKQSWWCLPMLLIYVPVSAFMNGKYATTPEWWALVDVTFLKDMPLSCAIFLGSNIFYFLSGLYLLNRMPLLSSTTTRMFSNKSHGYDALEKNASVHTARYPMLGGLLLGSGIVSVIYHAFQVLGHIPIAESLCYVDHGVAVSAACYFLQTCGLPSLKTLSLGIPSLALLACPGDAYPLLHSLWHLTSAGTAASWALDGIGRRKNIISTIL